MRNAATAEAGETMTSLTIGVLAETAKRERRVALDPDTVGRLVAAGRAVLVETDAGRQAGYPDTAYQKAGASVVGRAEVVANSDAVAVVRLPDQDTTARLRRGQLLLGLLDPLNAAAEMRSLAERGVTVAAFELLPRTLSRAQSMDALTSQASAAGYRAGIVAAEAFGRYFPMMITAAGTARPASALVIGTGVAGLQAIGTVKRLGAMTTGYDVRPTSRDEVESLGAQFLTSSITAGDAAGGYARALTAEEQARQQDELAEKLTTFDIVITTAKVPGRTPPVLVSTATLAKMRPGSVCVDLGASERGGNVAGSVDGERIITPNGVAVIGGGDLASELPASASQMYARNVAALLESLAKDGTVTVDPADEVHAAVVVCHDGRLTSGAVRRVLDLGPFPGEAKEPASPGAAAARPENAEKEAQRA